MILFKLYRNLIKKSFSQKKTYINYKHGVNESFQTKSFWYDSLGSAENVKHLERTASTT